MAISLRVVVLLLVSLVGIAATVISLVPVHSTGLAAVRSTADLLRVEISHRLAGDVLAYFQAPMYGISALIDQHGAGYLNVTGSLVPWIPALSVLANRLKLPVWVTSPNDESCYADVGFITYAGYYYRDNATHSVEPATTRGAFLGTVSTVSPYNWTQLGPLIPVSTYYPTQRPWYAPLTVEQSWGPVYVEIESTTATALSPGGPMRNAVTGALEGVAVMELRNDFIFEYFSHIEIAKTGRAMLLHTSSRACLGGNWNESTVISVNNTYSAESRLAKVTEVQEPLFAQTVAALGEDGLFNVSLPYRTSFGSGADVVYIDIVQIADDYGLDLRLVVMIPEKDFLEEVNEQVSVVVGVVVAAVVVLLILAFIITAVLLQPLSTLEDRMYNVASFKEDKDGATDNTPSIISEVANIQAAFTTMTAELKRVKSYLPQSLLAKLENTSGDDEEDEEDGEEDGVSPPVSSTAGNNKSVSNSVMSDIISHSARSQSRHSGAASARRGVAVGLVSDDAVRFKKVTVVVVNVLHSHRRLRSDWHSVQENQTQLLEAVQVHSKKFKGVIDSFQGDHVVVTFNAVLGVASHQSKGAHFALALAKEFCQGFANELDTSVTLDDKHQQEKHHHHHQQQQQQPLTIGLASGDCLVGNMGTEGFKRFNVIGTAYSTAMILERLCKAFKVPILTNQHTANSLTVDTFLDALGACELPTANGNRPSVLYNVRAFKEQGHNAEWMYDLQAKEAMDMGVVLNEAWMSFVSEGVATERSKTVETPVSPAPHSATRRLVSDLNSKGVEADLAAEGTKSTKSGAPVFSAQQRRSLFQITEAVKEEDAVGALAAYLQGQAQRYFTDAQLPGFAAGAK